jgi:hypothetical protein
MDSHHKQYVSIPLIFMIKRTVKYNNKSLKQYSEQVTERTHEFFQTLHL